MPRHIACLTFDFDVWSVFTARGMTTPTPVSRGEFGLVGAERILKLQFMRGQNFVLPGLMNAANVLGNWLDDFLYMTRNADWGVLTYTCHSFVIGRGRLMLMLERLVQALVDMGAVFLTIGEAVDEVLSRRVGPPA